MAGTYGDLQAQIALDLRRSNLTAEIKTAILDAIADHDGERFWFNELSQYTMVVTADDTTLVPQAPIQEFIKIDMIRARPNAASGTWYTLIGEESEEIDVLRSQPSSGQPARWALLGNVLQIWPTPITGGHALKIFGHYRLTPLVNDTDQNYWTNSSVKNLIRYTALKRLFVTPIRDAVQMASMEAAGMRELEFIRRETERRNRMGVMKAYG